MQPPNAPSSNETPPQKTLPQWAMLVHEHAALLQAYDALSDVSDALTLGLVQPPQMDINSIHNAMLAAHAALSRLPA